MRWLRLLHERLGRRLLQPLGLAYLIALFASLIVALTVTPVLSFYLLPNLRSVREGHDPAVSRWTKRYYGRWVPWTLDHRTVIFAAAGILLVLTALSLPRMGRAFLPEFNEGALVISAVTLPGTSLEASDQLGTALEGLLQRVPEVVSSARRTGRAERDEHVQGVESAEIDVKLRALNLEKGGQNTGANGQLAFAVEEAFKTNSMFEATGTKLADVQQSESTADTFTFGLKVQLKNGMQTM